MDATGRLLGVPGRQERARHVETIPARAGLTVEWPAWSDPGLVEALRGAGVPAPWRHQAEAAEAARAGRHVVVSTGTASGKSLGYLLPVLTAIREGARQPSGRAVTALYLAPTKALAADQLQAVQALDLDGVRAATYDGDTPPEERRWVRDHAGLVLTNPDLLHHSLLPGHARWKPFLRSLQYVVVDECHHYRGVFGSHVAAVLRRLRRVAARYGSDPVFILASATTADPAATARRLTGLEVATVAQDHSPRGRTDVILWEPPLLPGGGEHGAPTRRTALAETGELLADLVADGVRTLAFVPSRRGAELVAASARRLLSEVSPQLQDRVAAYRAGYLPEERRQLERALRDGSLLGLATTSALELGIDVAGLDAVLICGWPGRRSSLWQQTGRAGRRGRDAVSVLVARDDPLDTYLVHHPEAVFGQEVEATVLDPDNPYVLAPHLAAAAAELPLTEADLPLFGPATQPLLDTLVQRGVLRRRPTGWFWTRPERPTDLADLRGTGGEPVRIVEADTGRVLGTVDAGAAHHSVHAGAVYVHQGRSWLVRELDLADRHALVEPTGDEVATQAREQTDVRVLAVREEQSWGEVGLAFGPVEVTSQVVSFLRRDVRTGRVLGEQPLDLPARTLRTTAVWWTMPEHVLAVAGVDPADIPGAAHAAEHAAIGMLPLVATCDRWDIGGVSTALHPDTGAPTIFVHDGHPGGAGFAERGYRCATTWLRATRAVLGDCECDSGCPSCVQSPKCGNGNEPLDKAAAARLLDAVLGASPVPAGSAAASTVPASPQQLDLRTPGPGVGAAAEPERSPAAG
ncbi:MAG TPA: DEAD/DEAH box helicase [Kineosporiaceae bacterium]|nr:DEAD/DEAH box helicase [Kineosporiaceae bacterium]